MVTERGLVAEMERHLVDLMIGDVASIPSELADYLASKGALRGGRLDPVRAALACVEAGMSPERAASLLDWRGFELMVSEILEVSGFAAFRGVRFSHGAKRWEVDVLAGRPGLTLSVEVKMWSRRPRSAQLRAAAREHARRTEDLASEMGSLRDRLPLVERTSSVIPVVVSWLPPAGTVKGVPVVPLYSLGQFMSKVDSLPDSIVEFRSPFSLSPSLSPDRSSLAPPEKVR